MAVEPEPGGPVTVAEGSEGTFPGEFELLWTGVGVTVSVMGQRVVEMGTVWVTTMVERSGHSGEPRTQLEVCREVE